MFKNSRYDIKYNKDAQIATFYLAGATKENRQNNYMTLRDILFNLRDNNNAAFTVNHHMWENIDASIVLNIVFDETLKLFRVKAVLSDGFSTVDLGVLPTENGFDKKIWIAYQALTPEEQNNFLELHQINFAAWNGNTILIGLQVNGIEEPNLVSVVSTRNNTQVKKSVNVTVSENNFHIPSSMEFNSFDELKWYIYSQFAAMSFIKQMSVCS